MADQKDLWRHIEFTERGLDLDPKGESRNDPNDPQVHPFQQ